LPTSLVAVVVEDRDVVVVPEVRGSVRPLQGFAAERKALVFKIDIYQQWHPLP
jgi:hypothetical protein